MSDHRIGFVTAKQYHRGLLAVIVAALRLRCLHAWTRGIGRCGHLVSWARGSGRWRAGARGARV